MRKAFLLLLLFSFQSVIGQNLPERSNQLVNDFADFLSPSEEAELETKLRLYNDSTSTQIAIVLVKTLEGYDVSDYSNALARKWKIGQKGQNNGLLILASAEERKIRIEVGYGLEGIITDAISKRIIEKSLKPNFKSGNYFIGLNEATDNVILALKGEFKAEKKSKKDKGGGFAFFIILLFVIVLIIFTQSRKASNLSKKNNIPFWIAWALLNSIANSNSGRYRDFSGGGGSFGGGGGFGGFGGGDFGGGGASGDW